MSDERPAIAHLMQVDGPGGGPDAVINQMRALHQRHPTAVFAGGRGRIAAACSEAGATFVQLAIDRVWKWPLGAVQLWIALRRARPKVLVLHGQWSASLGAIVARLAGVPKMAYLTQWPSFYTDWDVLRRIRNQIAEWIPARLATRVWSPSESVRDRYIERFPWVASKICLLPNSIHLDELPDAAAVARARSHLDAVDADRHVVFLGRLADQKRVDVLLRAWVRVADADARAHLHIVGDGEERSALERLADELAIEERCTFHGYQTPGTPYLGASELVVMSSAYEAQAHIPLESMAMGRAIVSTAADGIRDSYRDGVEGRLVPLGDSDALADAMLELLRDPARAAAMGEAGREHVKRFDAPVVMASYASLIDELLAEA